MVTLRTVNVNHINELALFILIGAIFTNLWLVSYALLLGSWELFWRHALDLFPPSRPNYHSPKRHLDAGTAV